MYEFTNKELRKKFKETEYGKKTNKYLHISVITFFILLLIPIIFSFVCGLIGKSWEETESILTTWDGVYSGIMFIVCSIMIYFDGKRDGAIEQYKNKSTKKTK